MTPQLLAAARSWDTATLRRRVEDARENVRKAHLDFIHSEQFYKQKQSLRLASARNTLDALTAILREREGGGTK